MKNIIFDIFSPIVSNNYPELMEEIESITKGINKSEIDVKFVFFGIVIIHLAMYLVSFLRL